MLGEEVIFHEYSIDGNRNQFQLYLNKEIPMGI